MVKETPLTLVTTCKPFSGLDEIMQRNAIGSWRASGFKVIIVGQEEGVEQVCIELGCHHIPYVRTGPKGLPFVSSIFEIAEKEAETEYYAYINADIILCENSAIVFKNILSQLDLGANSLVTARRRNIPLLSRLDFSSQAWLKAIDQIDLRYGTWDHDYAIDFFMVNKGWLGTLPDLLVGRAGWDNWMLKHASELKAQIIDTSLSVRLYHPLHGYKVHQANAMDNRLNEESLANRRIIGKVTSTIENTKTHVVESSRVRKLSCSGGQKFPVDLNKLFVADFLVLQQMKLESLEDTINYLCVILSRSLRYMPIHFKCLKSKTDVKKVIEEIQALIDHNEVECAIDALQAFLLEDFLRDIKRYNRKVVIWGAGAAGRRLASFLNREKVPVDGFIDADPSISAIDIDGGGHVPCHSSEVISDLHIAEIFIILASMYHDEMVQTLEKHSFKCFEDYIY